MNRILFIILIQLSISLSSYAAVVQLPATGQTSCYDDSGNIISCAGTGQDGEFQAGVPWPTPRFVDNGNGTITDKLTGLIWLKNANCYGAQTWPNALIKSNNLASASCGLNDGSVAGDWRLANRKELRSLINRQQADSAAWLNAQGFINVQASEYWSSNTQPSILANALTVNIRNWEVLYNGKSTYFHFLWPVRGME